MSADSDGTHGFWPAGFSSGAVSAAIKYERNDLMLLVADSPASAAALFTRNMCCAAPITLSRDHLHRSSSSVRAGICNSGNANAATGEKGMSDAVAMAEAVAQELSVKPEEVLVASTGVIGQLMPMERVLRGISALPPTLQQDSGIGAAQAIMTTDTFPKCSRSVNMSSSACVGCSCDPSPALMTFFEVIRVMRSTSPCATLRPMCAPRRQAPRRN